MRKFLVAIASVVTAIVICLSSLAGCSLVEVDTERDMDQVVATVQIESSAPVDKIYKRDMIMAYLNYGYNYEQYYGYTPEQTFTLILDNLVKTRVFVQSTIKEYQQTYNMTSWDAVDYLNKIDQTEGTNLVAEAKYDSMYGLDQLIHGYEEHGADKKGDTLTEEVRAVPTGATNFQEEVDIEEKKAFKIDIDSTSARRTAFNKVVELLEVNGLLGDMSGKYIGTAEDLMKTEYYIQTEKNNYEAYLIEKYEKDLKAEVRAEYTFEKLNEAYVEKREEQKEWSNAEFVEKLTSATASDPLLYGFDGRYGYVYNLLIGASDVQTTKISAIDSSLSNEARAEERREILDATIIKEQRASWLKSGYDFDLETGCFTGDYTFTSPANSLKFFGQVEKTADADEEHGVNAQYNVKSVGEFTLTEFVDLFEEYIYGAKVNKPLSTGAYYKEYQFDGDVVEYDEKINELLFAFSTDPGSLNTYKGYAIQPKPDGADAEQYMQEFADAGRKLLTMGGKSYIMVATDYGYHVMFFSEVLNTNYGYDTLEDYLDASFGQEDWSAEFATLISDFDEYEDKENYMYLLLDSLSSTATNKALTDYQNKVINKYIYGSDTCVITHPEVYSDLLG